MTEAHCEPISAYRCTACSFISCAEQGVIEHIRAEHEPPPPGTRFCATCKRHQCAGSLHPSMCVYADRRAV